MKEPANSTMLRNSSPTIELIFRAPHRKLSTLYIGALIGIAVVVIAGQAFIHWSFTLQKNQAGFLTAAGQQRYLSERMGNYVLQAQLATDEVARRTAVAKFTSSISTWRSTFDRLRGHKQNFKPFFNEPPPQLETSFANLERAYEGVIRSAACLTTPGADAGCAAESAEQLRALERTLEQFGNRMGELIPVFEAHAAATYNRFANIQTGVPCVILLLLIFEGLFIFRPAARELRAAFDTVANARLRIGQDAALLKQTNAALNEALRDSQEAAERQAEYERKLQQGKRLQSLGRLAGGIAHDFNNILFAILGYTQMALLKCEKETRVSRNLEEVIKAANRAKQLVDQILVFSQWKDKEVYPVALEEVVEGTIGIIEHTLPLNVQIVKDVDRDASWVQADVGHMYQLMSNLCQNAIQAMQPAGGTLTVTLRPAPDADGGNAFVELSVRDTGCGMPAEVQERIFEPFYTTKPVGEGTGLGLAAVHGIVEEHGGSILVESTEGVGTLFRVLLPAAQEGSVVELGLVGSVSIPKGGGKVLVVDDEASVLDVMSQMLAELHYEVEVESDPLEALKRLVEHQESFDLVIVDEKMPKLTGLSFLEKLRRFRPDLPVVLCTGFSDDISPREALARGCRACLIKPVSLATLATAVEDAICPTGLSLNADEPIHHA
ncbi:MAG: response regulator [Bdellovibrionales bacterium]|nr:response regulator [Bdellovibrionales bacterium]